MCETYEQIISKLALDIDNKKLWQKALKYKTQSQIFTDIHKQIADWKKRY